MAPMKTLLISLLCMLLHHRPAAAGTWTVGDESGWDYNVSPWPLGKDFKGGDMLVFNYDAELHDVTVLSDEADFFSCQTNGPHTVYKTGKDTIALHSGWNYFTSTSELDDCMNGMQLAVFAS